MREDYLHYLWQFQKLDRQEMKTSEGLPVKVISPGTHNLLSGPDFFNSRLLIGDQEWAGNVEIHIRSSDWYMHGHENDPAYDNVILHVVWSHDVDIYRKDNSSLPVVEIRDLVDPATVRSYEELYTGIGNRWINCENELAEVDDFLLEHWLERLFIERLENKSQRIKAIFERSAGDWEAVLFQMLARNFGLNINGEAFSSIAASIPFSVVRKVRGNSLQLEALFLGQAGLLNGNLEEPYAASLKQEYLYLKRKFQLETEGVLPVKYFRLRPDNFPELRLVQLAAVYHKHSSLFHALINGKDPGQLYGLFEVEPAAYWKTHYTLFKNHSLRKKKLSKKFLDLLLINTLIPVKFSFMKSKGKDVIEELIGILRSIPSEDNQIIKKYQSLRPGISTSSQHSQALLQLKKEYCDKNACLKCAIGSKILQKEHQI